MSRARARVLDAVRAQAEPVTLASLTRLTNLHSNTLREHLDGLMEAGLVRSRSRAPQGRGRPALVYEATGGDTTSAAEYAGLATTLAATIHRISRAPRRDGETAGMQWGRELAQDRGARPVATPIEARREVVDLLAGLGFAPEADEGQVRVRLTSCPLLDAAQRYPDVVCSVHLGLTRGALREYGVTAVADVSLEPFAEPGACLLHLTGTEAR